MEGKITSIEIGRLLRASTTGCVVGCRVSQLDAPVFGGMVSIPLEDNRKIYGLIHDIQIADDGLVRQLVTAEGIANEVIEDNRRNRNVPIEISVLFIGYADGNKIHHLLPPRPPLSLDAIYPCGEKETCDFTNYGRFGYLRHILRDPELPVAEILSTHIQLVGRIQQKSGNREWARNIVQEVITLLRDDYATLNTVLNALSDLDIFPQ